jgi:hypothetical protein
VPRWERDHYFEMLRVADTGDLRPLVFYVASCSIRESPTEPPAESP